RVRAKSRSSTRTHIFVWFITAVSSEDGSAGIGLCDRVALELHPFGAHRIGKVVEEQVPFVVDMQRGLGRRKGRKDAVRSLRHDSIRQQPFERVLEVEIDRGAELRQQILLYRRID